MMAFFGEQLKKLRLASKLTQKELGEELGCSRQIISDLELGKRLPSIEELEKINTFFDLVQEICEESEEADLTPSIQREDRAKLVFTKYYDNAKGLDDDKELLEEASTLLEQMGIDLTDGIRLFLIQVVKQQKIPFDIRL